MVSLIHKAGPPFDEIFKGSFFLRVSNYMVRDITLLPFISSQLHPTTGDIIHTTCI